MSKKKKPSPKSSSDVFQFSFHSIALGEDRMISVGEIVFHDPSSRNSFRLETARAFGKYLPQIEKNCDVLLFRAEGRVFCSGGNLKDHVAQGPLAGKLANREITKILASLSNLKIPTIAVVEGDALGGGLELLSAFDVVMAAPHALFGFWQRRLGLSFGWGGGARLARKISEAKLARLALEARAISANEALEVGLIDRVVAPWSLSAEARAEALRLASLPKSSVQAMKRVRFVSAAEAKSEQQIFEKLWYGPLHRGYLELKVARKKG